MNNLFRFRLLLEKSNNIIPKQFLSSNSFTQLSHEIKTEVKLNSSEEKNHQLPECSPIPVISSLIGSEEIRERQRNLMKLIDKSRQQMSGHKPNLILISGSSRQLLADTKIPSTHFKQNSDFIYLTGFAGNQSSDCVLVLMGGNGEPFQSILFAPFLDSHQELWEGNDIREHSFWVNSICDDLRDISKLKELVDSEIDCRQVFISKSGLSNGQTNVNQSANNKDSCDKLSAQLSNHLNLNTNLTLHKVSPLLDQLRVIKSESEGNAMRRVCRMGSDAMFKTMVWTKALSEDNLINESQIAAKYEFECRMNGARNIGFPTVCGSGERSTVIHYGANDQFCSAHDWVLMDAGCEDVDGYNSDITRTFPINGNFGSQALRQELYEALCEVQSDLISALSADPMMTLDLLFRLQCSLLAKVLIEFKVLDITVSPQEASALAFRFCPHHVSHYLGLDIHDCPTISRNTRLRPGHCFTVEPGLYFHKSHIIKPEFKGIGMRVEDDLLVDSEGQIEILTKGCPHKPNLL